MAEIPLTFPCEADELVAVVHDVDGLPQTGVVIVVGGPQYRIGSHRQFLLIARDLAARGIPVFRFDCRGMGDSGGNPGSFDALDVDIRAAIDTFVEQLPSLQRIVLWGLCDGASASAFYAPKDPRVTGLVLLNPWVHTEQGRASTQLWHYYLPRLWSLALWRKLFSGGLAMRTAAREVAGNVKSLKVGPGTGTGSDVVSQQPLPARMLASLQAFHERPGAASLFILSGNDLVAKEFLASTRKVQQWQDLLAGAAVSQQDLAAADHTFSRQVWQQQLSQWTCDWVMSLVNQ